MAHVCKEKLVVPLLTAFYPPFFKQQNFLPNFSKLWLHHCFHFSFASFSTTITFCFTLHTIIIDILLWFIGLRQVRFYFFFQFFLFGIYVTKILGLFFLLRWFTYWMYSSVKMVVRRLHVNRGINFVVNENFHYVHVGEITMQLLFCWNFRV